MDHCGPNRKGALVTSAQKRDDFAAALLLANGCTTQKISSLEQLRDALNILLPPHSQQSSSAQLLQSTKQQKHPSFDDQDVKRFELFRRVIEHEDDLLNQRVSWIILAQSFLMAAFITSTGGKRMKLVTAIVGLATVIVTMPAIAAAGRNIEVQQQVYFRQIESDERCQELHGHFRDLSKKDSTEIKRRLDHGHTFPNTAFRSGSNTFFWFPKILHTVLALSFVQAAGWIFLLIELFLE